MEVKSSAQTGSAVAEASHEDFSEFKQHVHRYLFVFYALLFGTLATVGASYIPWGNHEINIGVALFIAVCKGSLVACYFMHLISERRLIYGILIFTAFFFLGLMFLTLSAYLDFPFHTVTPYAH
jgi:cytochrome c oxidase subunit IV